MIHLATLIHDDVLDNAKTRRHKETAHSKFGTRRGVLLGDYLFTHSFSVGSKSNSVAAVKTLAQASNLVCEGEIKQNAWQSNFEITETQYLKMVSEKTGELCAAGCGIGAILAGTADETVSSFKSFGRDLGVAFQIIDDVLDLVGDAETVGKTLGTDLQNRKVTLPVIHALENLSGDEKASFLQILNRETVPVEKVVSMLSEIGSIDYARLVAKTIAERAVAFTNSLPKSDAAKSLAAIGKMTLKRTY
jgi:octaprenyl-diphosphate synthase